MSWRSGSIGEAALAIQLAEVQQLLQELLRKPALPPEVPILVDPAGRPFVIEGKPGGTPIEITTTTPIAVTPQGLSTVVGPAAAGQAPGGAPVLAGGKDSGGLVRELAADTSGRIQVVGAGSVGTPDGGVITVQGDSAHGSPIPVFVKPLSLGGIGPVWLEALSGTLVDVFFESPGTIYYLFVSNHTGNPSYLQIHNNFSAVLGVSNPAMSLRIPGNTILSWSLTVPIRLGGNAMRLASTTQATNATGAPATVVIGAISS